MIAGSQPEIVTRRQQILSANEQQHGRGLGQRKIAHPGSGDQQARPKVEVQYVGTTQVPGRDLDAGR